MDPNGNLRRRQVSLEAGKCDDRTETPEPAETQSIEHNMLWNLLENNTLLDVEENPTRDNTAIYVAENTSNDNTVQNEAENPISGNIVQKKYRITISIIRRHLVENSIRNETIEQVILNPSVDNIMHFVIENPRHDELTEIEVETLDSSNSLKNSVKKLFHCIPYESSDIGQDEIEHRVVVNCGKDRIVVEPRDRTAQDQLENTSGNNIGKSKAEYYNRVINGQSKVGHPDYHFYMLCQPSKGNFFISFNNPIRDTFCLNENNPIGSNVERCDQNLFERPIEFIVNDSSNIDASDEDYFIDYFLSCITILLILWLTIFFLRDMTQFF